jgi:hypothetical protein
VQDEKSKALPDIFASLQGLEDHRKLFSRHVVAQNGRSIEAGFSK